ncbi:MAG: hypothetical protein IRZ16_12020 [Myxococcaceae bacterium]|nr:hypothetical protein [Myxococcaceae bacterium]
MRALPVALLALVLHAASLSGCAGRRAVPADEPQSLAGLEAPLESNGAVRLGVAGSVEGRPALVMFEVAQPRTSVALGCFDEEPKSHATVRFSDARGGMLEASEIEIAEVQVGGRRLGALDAAAAEGDECVLTLGSDVLMPYALTIDPGRRSVRIGVSRPREVWLQQAATPDEAAQTKELHLLELVRDLTSDWPLLAVRARQGEAQLTGAFVLSTSLAESYVDAASAERAGLQRGSEVLRDLGFPEHVELPKSLGTDLFTLERIELSPGFGLRFTGLRADEGWSNPGAVGLLGGDVWGRFVATVDVAAGVLALERPRVFSSGGRQRCVTAADGSASEEACFVLHQTRTEEGLDVVTTVWRDLPRGARVYFDVLDGQGQPIGGMCRVGFTFPRSDRGVTAAHELPWKGLVRGLPGCAQALAHAAEVRFGLWEEGSMAECPGTCAFVVDNVTARVSCECQTSTVGVMNQAERQFMELYRDLQERKDLKRQPPTGRGLRDEPADPQ